MGKTRKWTLGVILIAIICRAHMLPVQSHVSSFKKRPDPSRGGVLRWSLPYYEICQCQRVLGPQLPPPCDTKNEYREGELWFTDDQRLVKQLTMRRNWKKEILDELLQRNEYCALPDCPGSYWKPLGSHVYCFVHKPIASYAEAEIECDKMGAQLASIHSQEEQDFIGLHYEHNEHNGYEEFWWGFWIGFDDINIEGAFEWTDETPVNFTYWNPGEPSGRTDEEADIDQDCTYVVEKQNNKWDDNYCTRLFISLHLQEVNIICGAIKQIELEVGDDMLLVSKISFISFKFMLTSMLNQALVAST